MSLKRLIQDVTDAVFNDLTNIVLLRRDSYLEHLRLGVRPDTAIALRGAPIHLETLFADDIVAKAEKEVVEYDNRPPPPRRDRDRGGHPYRSSGNSGNSGSQQPQKRKDDWKKVSQRVSASKATTQEKQSFPSKSAGKNAKK